jgi:hypothetical protein
VENAKESAYDIIGDVHGYADKLVHLLTEMGYRERNGAWRHPERHAIFVGDLVDRGPAQVVTVNIVRAMVDAGSARCIMGNHEFNAIAWNTPDPGNPAEYLRPHAKSSNRAQHAQFLAEVEGKPLHKEMTDWFRTLPMFIEEPNIRVVHACWHAPSIAWLRARCEADGTLSSSLIEEGSRTGTPAYSAIETVCKGIEAVLPDGVSFRDKDGKERHEARIRWWDPNLETFRHAAIGPDELLKRIPDVPFPVAQRPAPYEGPPVFFGHYWFTGAPRVLGSNAACVDYSVGKGGPIVAYRWNGEQALHADNFVCAS